MSKPLRVATYNVEWFNALFDDDGVPVADDKWSSRRDVTRAMQLEALGVVFTALDADAVMVVEAPDAGKGARTVTALERFANLFKLRANTAIIGFANDTQQEIALLYDPEKLSARHDPWVSDTAPQFDDSFDIDLDIDAKSDTVRFSKPPLELAIETATGGAFRMIGVHVKSKAPHGARNQRDVMRISIANRRKQLAQAIWLRRRVDQVLAQKEPLIVLGDFNDGPGLDEYEALFGRSAVEIVMGAEDVSKEPLHDPHARSALQGRFSAREVTARFYQARQGKFLSALLDYIMVSDAVQAHQPEWRIWHPFDDPMCYQMPELREALLTASDHFPVTLDLEI